MNHLFNRAFTGAKLYSNQYVLGKTPVVVYAPGRVGSMSMILALQKAGVYSFKVENLSLEKWGSVKFCKKHIFDRQQPAKVISLVREPIEIMSSFFFSKGARGHLPLAHAALQEKNLPGLLEAFEKEILASDHLSHFLNWFDNEFKTHTGIDVYQHTFNKQEGFGIIEHDKYPTLILKTKLANKKKEALVKDFLHIDNFSLDNLNVRAKRGSGALYQTFKESLVIPEHYKSIIVDSPYMQHFLSP